MRDILRRTLYSRSYALDFLVAILLITTIYYLVVEKNINNRIQSIAIQNHTLSVQNKQVLDEIKSCTNPRGVCAQAGLQIRNRNTTVIVATIACADKPGTQTVDDIQKCVASLTKTK